MGNEVQVVNRENRDPSAIGWPPMLVIELALGEDSPKQLCETYGISRDRWDEIRVNPLFIKDLESAVNELKKDGVSFKVKARLQAEAMLPQVWKMVHASHDQVPPSVKSDLFKHLTRVAGLDASRETAVGGVGGTALQININLSRH